MVWLARWLEFSPGVVAAVAVVVIAGHIWPLWHHFQGGKGIATGFGAFVTLDYKIVLIGVVVPLVFAAAIILFAHKENIRQSGFCL